ncbi:hypothetical protein LIA77_01922 [Sarocladium implicatum]|nr:hypothetical protein LIA77_01922 [Sarocladium implicatum]
MIAPFISFGSGGDWRCRTWRDQRQRGQRRGAVVVTSVPSRLEIRLPMVPSQMSRIFGQVAVEPSVKLCSSQWKARQEDVCSYLSPVLLSIEFEHHTEARGGWTNASEGGHASIAGGNGMQTTCHFLTCSCPTLEGRHRTNTLHPVGEGSEQLRLALRQSCTLCTRWPTALTHRR